MARMNIVHLDIELVDHSCDIQGHRWRSSIIVSGAFTISSNKVV